jgi:anti-sigma factor RsiW
MSCEWGSKLDLYADAELPESEMAQVEAHLRTCASCAAEALGRMQMKRSIHAAAARAFTPSPEFRIRVTKAVGGRRKSRLYWLPQIAFATAVIVAVLGIGFWARHTQQTDVLAEIADMHVATLASANPVDVVSTDRHTVKPWFEGKLPFTFDLPELQNTDFRLIGGRVAYVGQSPSAQLLFGIRKHQISVFILRDSGNLAGLSASPMSLRKLAFNMESWSDSGLRYIAIGDVSAEDVRALGNLLRSAKH